MDWGHGYCVATPYTSNFYRELSPDWLDFAFALKGFSPPRGFRCQKFSYLDLGSGMGLGLCILAALFPEGDFTGIDFMPEHIVHSRQLADRLGLNNISFVEADLIDLSQASASMVARDLPPSSFHYVVSHGLLSWISPAVFNGLLQLASSCLRPEGIFYGSYNTYPGWLGMSLFQHLVQLELERGDPSHPLGSLQHAAAKLNRLIGTEDKPTPLHYSLPSLRRDLQQLANKDPAYLVQEYANQHWQPVFVADLHQRCLTHKLRYVASATLPDMLENLMPEPVHSLIHEEPNLTHRQTLLDLATNRSFRRDLFSRGSMPLREGPLQSRLEAITVRLQESPSQSAYTFRTDFGEVTGQPKIYASLETALEDGPQDLGTIADVIDQPIQGVMQAVALLLHANRIGLDRGEAALPPAEALRLNKILLDEISDGAPYRHLIAPSIGTAVGISQLEALLLQALQQNLEGPMLTACVQMGLQALNAELREVDGKPLRTDAARRKAIHKAAERFLQQRLPYLQALGVVPPAAVPPSKD